jgi:hypothetical protein
MGDTATYRHGKPLPNRIAAKVWRHIAEHLLGCVKIRALRQF